MENNAYLNVKKFILSLFLILFTLSLGGFFALANFNFASANEGVIPKAKLSSPQTQLELNQLSSPTAVYRDESLTAIIEDKNKLTIYLNNELLDTISLNKLEDVKRQNENTLLFTTDARLYRYDLTTKNYQQIKSKGLDFAVSYFDVNAEYAITAYQESCDFYHLDGDFSKINSSPIKIKNGTNVAINDNNEIFLVLSDGIYKTNTDNLLTGKYTKISTETPSTIIADNYYLYFIKGNDNSIYKIDASSTTTTGAILLPTIETLFELGKIDSENKPMNVAFCGDNLLVIVNDTIQEFSVEKDTLAFTGFAVAKDKTAYNRISKNAVNIQTCGDKLAVLDNNKLTVIKADSQNAYDNKNYQNYLLGLNQVDETKFIDNDINHFAIGEDKIIYSTSLNNRVKLLDLTEDDLQKAIKDITPSELTDTTYLIDDICYQSGYFYLLSHTSTLSKVYKINQDNGEYKFNLIFENADNSPFNMLCVDVFGNLNLADESKIFNFKLNDNNQYQLNYTLQTANSEKVKELETDLGGNLFVLTDKGLNCVKDNALFPIEITKLENGDTITSFTQSFDKKEVYFICDGKEYICYSDELNNLSITDAKPNADYKITDNSTEFNNLKLFKVKDGFNVNVYSVKQRKPDDKRTDQRDRGYRSPNAPVFRSLFYRQTNNGAGKNC